MKKGLFISAGRDGKLFLWDTRSSKSSTQHRENCIDPIKIVSYEQEGKKI